MTTSDIAYTPILPEGWTRPRGFSHAVVATGARSVRIAGQIGREPGQAHIPPGTDAGTQWKVALGNLVTVLKGRGRQARAPGGAARLRHRHRRVQRRRRRDRRRVGFDAPP